MSRQRVNTRQKKNEQGKRNKLLLVAAIVLLIGIVVGIVFIKLHGMDQQRAATLSGQNGQPTAQREQVIRIESDYERWLAAAMCYGLRMQYIGSETEIQGIYLASSTSLDDHGESAGAYLLVKIDGEQFILESKPLEAERTEAGTIDLYTRDMGYATYDQLAPDAVDLSQMEQVTVDDLVELIEQSVNVSVMEH